MKIVIISHLYPSRDFPANGSFIREYYLDIRKKIKAQMAVPTVHSLPFTRRWNHTHQPFITEDEAVRLKYLSFPNRRFPRIIQWNISAAITAYLEKKPVELVHINWLYPDGLAIPALKKLGIPVVLTIHGSDWYKTGNRSVLKSLLFNSLSLSDTIFTVGQKLKDDIIAEYPELMAKIHVIHNAVNFSKFIPPANRNDALRKVKWNPAQKHVLCVANISPEKGVDVLIDAYRHFEKKDVVLHILGNIPVSRYSRSVLSRIKQIENIILHPPVTHDEIHEYYQACDVFVLPSRREGFGLSLAEAIACGKPVVSTKSGGPEEIVTSENGYLVDTDSSDQLSEKINYLLSGSFPHTSKTIRMSIRQKFSHDVIMNQMISFYQKVID